jgi:hypothetical protein
MHITGKAVALVVDLLFSHAGNIAEMGIHAPFTI